MTAEELIHKFNTEKWEFPSVYYVDPVTYANCCQFIFNKANTPDINLGVFHVIALGPNKGLIFKNVELMLVEGTIG